MRNDVNDRIDEEMMNESRRIEDDPMKILALIDIIFMNQDRKDIPS